ncbi:MAG: radical SAM protein [bacterium]|nr:radical SAM protein [bacterium]
MSGKKNKYKEFLKKIFIWKNKSTCSNGDALNPAPGIENLYKLKKENYLKAEKYFIEKDSEIDSFPLHAYLEVSKLCNLDCIMCPGHHFSSIKIPPESGLLSRSIFDKLEYFFPYLLRVDLSGDGEPLLNQDLYYFIERLKLFKIFVSFITNGLLLNRKKSDMLLEYGLDQMIFSIDSPREDIYKKIRIGSDLKIVSDNLKYISNKRRELGNPLFISINTILMKENEEDIRMLIDFASKIKADQLIINPLLYYPDEKYLKFYNEHKPSVIDRPDWKEQLQMYKTEALDKGLDFQTAFFSEGQELSESDSFCAEPWTTIYVLPLGEVRTCCLNEVAYGDLNKNTAGEIWFGEAFKRLRFQINSNSDLNIFCRNCIKNSRTDNFFNAWNV